MTAETINAIEPDGAQEPPVVSVCVLTYNHECFIRTCLDSILEQEVDFRFELLIGEDDSPDGTRAICREYAERHPELIRLVLNSREDVVHVNGRPTAQGNFSRTMSHARGRYMILCDGDDYWCDRNKLAKQVAWLEAHPDCSGCFHRISRVDAEGGTIVADCGAPPGGLALYDQAEFLARGGISPLFSVLFRNRYQAGLPDWIMGLEYVDLPLHFNNTQHGPYGYLDELMGCYRIHGAGMANGAARRRIVEMTINAYLAADDALHFRDRAAFERGIRALRWSLRFERVAGALLPGRLKGWFDQGFGITMRRIARRVLPG